MGGHGIRSYSARAGSHAISLSIFSFARDENSSLKALVTNASFWMKFVSTAVRPFLYDSNGTCMYSFLIFRA